MTERLPPIKRPNGKLYCPRRIVAHEVGGEDGITEGVLILGTHDEARAKPLADQFAQYLLGSGYAALDPLGGWYRDGFESGQRQWVSDKERGRAGVWFRRIAEAPVPP